MLIIVEKKYKCPRCNKMFDEDEISLNKSYCKTCYREYMRDYMKKRRSKGGY